MGIFMGYVSLPEGRFNGDESHGTIRNKSPEK